MARARGGGGSDGHGEPGRADNGSSWWLRAAAVGASLVIAGCSAAYLISRTRDRRRKPNDQKGAKEDLARVPRVRQRKLLPALFDEGCGLAIRKLMDTADVTSVAERLCLKDDMQDAEDLDPSSGSCIWVGTIEELWSLREDLRREPEVSLDLEHHSWYSFRGTTCLLQVYIPSKRRGYLVDGLALRDEVGPCLGPMMRDPAVLKVVHGAGNDVLWLQRDFGCFLVNVFDTEVACKVLGKDKISLKHLLAEHFGVAKDSKYQKADWRVRPLPQDMASYAIRDACYLPKLKRALCKELLERSAASSANPTKFVLAYLKSQKVSLRVYKDTKRRPQDMAMGVLRKAKQRKWEGGKRVGLGRLVKVVEWRTKSAEECDVSMQAMLPDYAVAAVAAVAAVGGEGATEESVMEAAMRAVKEHDSPYLDTEIFEGNLRPRLAALVEAVAAPLGSGEGDQGGGGRMGGKVKDAKGEQRWLDHVERFRRKKPAYEQCKIYDMEGQLLCYCDQKKLAWYLKKKIAKQMPGEKDAVQLLFKHRSADQQSGESFYLESKANTCVACGEDRNFLKYHVIPKCYRQNFPLNLKSHRSHDIVLLCVRCHQIAAEAVERTKKEISEETGVPLNVHVDSNGRMREWTELKQAYKSAMTLASKTGLPRKRQAQLKSAIAEALGLTGGADDVDDSRVAEVISMSKSRGARKVVKELLAAMPPGEAERARAVCEGRESGQYLHGRMVVERLVGERGDDALLGLIVRFREAFVRALDPKFLPRSWSVEHDAKREFGDRSVYNEKNA